jgi:hypothetical protein
MPPIGTPTPIRKVSRTELIVLVVLIVGALCILLPALPASRETARANLCRRNLRGLHQLTQEFVKSQHRLPDAATWPVDLLPRLQYQSGDRRHVDVFTMRRPSYLTCPARVTATPVHGQTEPSNYEFIVDRDLVHRSQPSVWSYRDLPADLPESAQQPWYIGKELTFAAAEEQRQQSIGPHTGGTFLGIDDQGHTSVIKPSKSLPVYDRRSKS